MMKSEKAFICSVVVMAALFLMCSVGERIMLVADEEINVASSLNGDRVVGSIHFGQTVQVLSCKDLKHYIVPKVRLPGGGDGYVMDGKFHLIRSSMWQFKKGPISFSCS